MRKYKVYGIGHVWYAIVSAQNMRAAKAYARYIWGPGITIEKA